MTDTAATPEGMPATEDFAALLEESPGRTSRSLERTVVKGTSSPSKTIRRLIDVGLKSEGRVSLKEFAPPGQAAEISVGDEVEVFVERIRDSNGEAVLSREKARREEAWEILEKAFENTERVTGLDLRPGEGRFYRRSIGRRRLSAGQPG